MSDPNPTGPAHVDDMNDIVLAGIAADTEAGRCWACRCEPGQPHERNCPEVNTNA